MSFIVRLFRLDHQSLWMDEATSAYLTTLSPLRIVLNRANNLHPPTYFLALAGWSELAGRSEFSLRFFSVWMSVLLVPLLYRAGRRLFADRRAGLLAAFLAALSPASVVYAQEVRMYALMPVAYLLVLINALPPDGLRSRRDWAWLALSEIVCLYLHFFSIFIVLAINLLLLISLLTRKRAARRSPQFWRRWITSQMLVALSYVPWLLAMARWGAEVPGKLSRRDWRASGMGLLGFLRMVWEFLNSGLVGSGKVDLMGRWFSGIAAVTAIALLLAILLDRRRAMLLKTLGGGLLPLLGAYPVWYMRPLAHPRYLLFLGAPLALTLGRTVSVLTRRETRFFRKRSGKNLVSFLNLLRNYVGVILLVAIVGGDLMALRLALFDERFFRADVRALAASLSERARPGEAALMPPDDYSLWYYDPAPAELVNLPGEIGAEGGRLRLRELGPLLEDRPGAFLVTYRELRDIDPRDQLPFLLEANGRLVERFSVDRMDVARYDLESDWAFPQTEPLAAASGPLALTGVYTQAVAEADGAVTVALRWRLTEPTEFDYKATVRLWDQGQQLAFDDARLLNELGRPTSYWERGEEALNTYVLPLPLGTPPLTYTLGVKVYGGPEQSWRGGEEWRVLGPVRLLRAVGQFSDPYGSWSGTDWRSVEHNAEVAPGLVLEGYTTRPKELEPGDTLYVSLRWRAAGDDEDGGISLAHYAPDLMLLRDGEVLARDPGSLFQRYPTERWAAGELLIETRKLAIPPTLASLQLALVIDDRNDRVVPLREVAIARDALQWELPERAQPACARLGDVAELAGYELRMENGEWRIENGEEKPGFSEKTGFLTLYWRASDEAPADHSYTVFVHLLGPDGELLAQHDTLPQNGERPTTTWLPDEIIADPHNLRDASCKLQLGMYDLATMERLPAYDCEGRRLPNDAIPLLLQESATGGPR